MRIQARLGIILLCVVSAFSCSTTANPQEATVEHFEVASLRISQDRIHRWTQSEPGAQEYTVTNATLPILLYDAFGYGVSYPYSGLPKWANSTWYTLRAKAPEGRNLSAEELRLPLQHLLEERLHLRWHMEKAKVSGSALVVGKNGPKLTPTVGGAHRVSLMSDKDNGWLTASNASLDEFTQLIAAEFDTQTLANNTGLKGRYDFHFSYAVADSTQSIKRPLLKILHEDFGLDVIKAEVERKTLVIDHVDETPEEN
jgi:uncharacterized protein (TIGR03435 family)